MNNCLYRLSLSIHIYIYMYYKCILIFVKRILNMIYCRFLDELVLGSLGRIAASSNAGCAVTAEGQMVQRGLQQFAELGLEVGC